MIQMRRARTVLGAAGLLAVIGGAAACGSGGERVAGQVAAESSACARIHGQLAAGQAVDVGAAQQCDQVEFGALENERQAARAAGEKPAMRNSATCEAVNARAARGDATLDFNLAFHCRQRERFANTVNAQNGVGEPNKVTSLCLGVRARKARGEAVDPFVRSFCDKEEAAAGGAGTGGQGGQAGAGQTAAPTPAASAPAAPSASPAPPSTPPASNGAGAGSVVCAGSTVTLSGESGAPAASSNTLPIGSRVKVTNLDNGKSTTVRVTSVSGSCTLLNNAAFEQVREPGKFLIRRARIERVA
ncbi:hypothetical protein [Actinomadura fibrosa]|uniref:Uncharacterized protein n=1 Tax=Actinomadura fibrosa TaxID=111802 RepID=A0ABW2XJS9_9ACTN